MNEWPDQLSCNGGYIIFRPRGVKGHFFNIKLYDDVMSYSPLNACKSSYCCGSSANFKGSVCRPLTFDQTAKSLSFTPFKLLSATSVTLYSCVIQESITTITRLSGLNSEQKIIISGSEPRLSLLSWHFRFFFCKIRQMIARVHVYSQTSACSYFVVSVTVYQFIAKQLKL